MSVDDMVFCFIPAGPFWMGSDEYGDEKPPHLNELLSYDYWMSRYPITNSQFMVFVKAGGYSQSGWWREAAQAGVWTNGEVKSFFDDQPRSAPYDSGTSFNLPNHPVVGITWYEALAFTRWLTERWHREGRLPKTFCVRLPTEAQWEKAARGGVEIPVEPVTKPIQEIDFDLEPDCESQQNELPKRRHPWGEKPNPNCANYGETKIGTTSTAGCFLHGASPYGCEEMSGNVWEWCRTKWRENYDTPADDSLEGSTSRVLRGGAFFDHHRHVRCAFRHWFYPYYRSSHLGFRVVVSP